MQRDAAQREDFACAPGVGRYIPRALRMPRFFAGLGCVEEGACGDEDEDDEFHGRWI